MFKRAPGYGPKFSDFEKQAWAEFGPDVVPEITVLHEELRIPAAFPLFSAEKIAHLQAHLVVDESKELSLLKEAVAARQTHQKMSGALAWVDANMPALGR